MNMSGPSNTIVLHTDSPQHDITAYHEISLSLIHWKRNNLLCCSFRTTPEHCTSVAGIFCRNSCDLCSVVVKDLRHEDKDKDKDLMCKDKDKESSFKDKDKDKDLVSKDEDKDEDLSFKDKDKDKDLGRH